MKVIKPLSAALAVAALCGSVMAQPVPLQPKPGDPLTGLTVAQRAAFDVGKQQFDRVFTAAEGLGPIFNQNSCASCHSNPVGGSGTILVTRFGHVDPETGAFDPLAQLGGSLRQDQAITLGCEEIVPAAANVTAMRVTNSTLGAGLVEAIPDADILQYANTPPGSVSGIAHMVTAFEDPTMTPRPGRFGWKAQVATVLTFSADATLNEIGITNRFLTAENAPNGDPVLLANCDNVPDPEDAVVPGTGLEFIDHVTNFQRYVSAPPQTPKSGMTGETIFNTIGCADCHRAQFTTSNDPSLEAAIRNKVIKPYSDFLLHDMGAAADFIEQGAGGLQEIRTPSLWGVRFRDPLWHDGRVTGPTLQSRITGTGGVIDQHNAFGSEAQPSAQAFLALSGSDQAAVIAFLDSLGKKEFDGDGDGDVDYQDLTLFENARTGPGVVTYTADDPEAVFDLDQDGDVDDDDYDGFVLAFEVDCNNNGVGDLIDIIVNGTSPDFNTNLIPDECDFLQTDLGFQFGNPTLTIGGDDLSTAGSTAALIIDGMPANQVVCMAISTTQGMTPVVPGAIAVPGLPWDSVFMFPVDGNGRFVTQLFGGDIGVMDFYVQAGYMSGATVELTNALRVNVGQ